MPNVSRKASVGRLSGKLKSVEDHAPGQVDSNAYETKLIQVVSAYPGIRRKELAVKLGVSIRTLDRLLAQMTSHPLVAKIEHRGSKKTGGWFRKS